MKNKIISYNRMKTNKSLNVLSVSRKKSQQKLSANSAKYAQSSMPSLSSVKSIQSLKSLKSYMKTKQDNKKYLWKFFKKSDLKFDKSSKYEFDLFVLPKHYYLWKGIDKGAKYDPSMSMNSFYANKEVAAIYGTQKEKPGTDLQFKIIKEIKLFDLGNIDNIIKIFKILDKITYEDLQNDSNKFFYYLRTNFESNYSSKKYDKETYLIKCIEMYKSLLIETTANFALNEQKRIKTPTKCERKSCEWFDNDLVAFFHAFDDDFDGWIHFQTDFFHDEILLFDTNKHLKFIDYHLI